MTPTDNASTLPSWRNAITTNLARPFPLYEAPKPNPVAPDSTGEAFIAIPATSYSTREALKPNPVAPDSTREAFIAIPATSYSTREAPNPNAAKPFSICEVSTVKEITNP